MVTLKEKTEKEVQKEAEKEAKSKVERLKNEERLKKEKEAKKEEGLNALLGCSTLADGFKLLKESFGKKPKPTNKEKEIIEKFKNQFKNSQKEI
jgi:hypothetical protein